jgi:hypothetical protein
MVQNSFNRSTIRKQVTIKKLKGPIAIPMFTTNPNQHTAAHLLTWLPLHNKKKAHAIRKTKQKTQTGTK